MGEVPKLDLPGALSTRVRGRELEVIVNGGGPAILELLRARSPEELRTESLSLEEIFTVTLQ